MVGRARGYDVFVSYSRDDEVWVSRLKHALEKKGLTVWFDRDQIKPGERFVEVLERGAEESRCAVFVVSRSSLLSEWVKEEYYNWLWRANNGEAKVRLIPLLIGQSEPRGFLASRQYIDFRDERQFDAKLELLCQAILDDERASPAFERAPAPGTSSVDPTELLRRLLTSEERSVREVEKQRQLVFALCLLLFAALVTVYRVDWIEGFWLSAGVILPSVAVGLTQLQLVQARSKQQMLAQLKDLTEVCGNSVEEGCQQVRKRVWQVAFDRAGVVGAGT